MPDGLDLNDIPADVLDVFKLATVRIDFSPERMAATLADAGKWAKVDDLVIEMETQAVKLVEIVHGERAQ